MEGISVIHGATKELPQEVLIHEHFRQAVAEQPDTAQASGVYFQGQFMSYSELDKGADLAVRALRKRLRNHLLYNRAPVLKPGAKPKPSGYDTDTSDITGGVSDISIMEGGSLPVPIPDTRGRLDRLRSRLKSVPPVAGPPPLEIGTGSYEETLSLRVNPAGTEAETEYQAACVVAVDVSPGPALLTVLLATLRLGAAYLPVDSQSAINRLRYILREAAPLCILADAGSAFLKDTDTVWSRYHVIDIRDVLMEAQAWSREEKTDNETDSVSLPCCHDNGQLSVIYTSGSTGMPKGVKITHRAAMNRLNWQWDGFPFAPNTVGCFKTSLLFVDSIVEIFSCLLKLVPLVVAPRAITSNPEAFVSLLEEHGVTRLIMVPSLLRSILFYLSISGGSSRLPSLALWVCNSETFAPALLEKFFLIYPEGKQICNFYGSTETMADVTYIVLSSADDINTKSHADNLSIGRPMYNSSVYILDDRLEVVKVGEVGELCITGLNVADGYLDNVASAAFVDNPFSDDPNHRTLYHSGDFARIVLDGKEKMIVYEGRRDLQVKIRGQRVNIAEVERVVAEVGAVERVTVLVHRFSPITEVIVAYYSCREVERGEQGPRGSGKVGRSTRVESEIARACQKSLPPYMRPKLLYVDEFPLQAHTGKVDRMALRRLYEKAFNRQSSQELAILDKKSQKAVNIIALNLNLPTHGVPKRLSFFQLGGTSVTMMSTIVQLKQHGLHIPIEIFSSASSIQEIIDHVAESQEPIGEILRTDKYAVLPMHDVADNDIIVDILTDSFIEKEPLDVLLGVTRAEFITFARSLYREASRGRMSLIVVDKGTRQIVGGDFLFDYFRGLRVEHHETMTPILTLFQEFETPIRRHLTDADPGPLLLNYCLCVHKDLPHAEQVKICHLIEGHVIKVARDNRYVGVVTNNTNPVTQDICQYFYDYEILSALLVKDFVFNGRKVFAHAPEDYRIKMMIKYV